MEEQERVPRVTDEPEAREPGRMAMYFTPEPWALARWLCGPVEFVEVGRRDQYTFYLAYYTHPQIAHQVRCLVTEIREDWCTRLVIANCYGGLVWTICTSMEVEAGQVHVVWGRYGTAQSDGDVFRSFEDMTRPGDPAAEPPGASRSRADGQ